ncbi:hypothetical protein H0W91_02175 [Patescibacteria group bacterium]|nr:hypothetical protein [Patescibacteria group bacterium]
MFRHFTTIVVLGVLLMSLGCGSNSTSPSTTPPIVTPPVPTGPVTVQIASFPIREVGPFNPASPIGGWGGPIPAQSVNGVLSVEVVVDHEADISIYIMKNPGNNRLVPSDISPIFVHVSGKVRVSAPPSVPANTKDLFLLVGSMGSYVVAVTPTVLFTPDK